MWSLLLFAATVWSFARLPLGLSDRNTIQLSQESTGALSKHTGVRHLCLHDSSICMYRTTAFNSIPRTIKGYSDGNASSLAMSYTSTGGPLYPDALLSCSTEQPSTATHTRCCLLTSGGTYAIDVTRTMSEEMRKKPSVSYVLWPSTRVLRFRNRQGPTKRKSPAQFGFVYARFLCSFRSVTSGQRRPSPFACAVGHAVNAALVASLRSPVHQKKSCLTSVVFI